ncbi:MAG: HAD family hydrolase [Kofleriaceae bacterium]
MAQTLRRLQPATLTTPAAVLFDLDGTLVDTMQIFADVAADVIVRHHGHPHARARRAYLTTSGVPFFQQLERIAPADPRNRDAAAEFERLKIEATAGIELDEATRLALAQLRGRGIDLAVCSNNFQAQVDAFVARCREPFGVALGFGNGLAKGPSQFDRACGTFGCGRDDLVFVGDSLVDAELARAAGIRFVGKLGTFTAEAFWSVVPGVPVVAEIGDLLELFV